MSSAFTILKEPEEILPFLDTIKKVTDANRNAFGFLSIGTYEDAIRNGKLWIAKSSDGNYLGHVMHGGKPPQEIRVFQIYVEESSRGLGVASSLIEEITKYGEELSCLNLRADVANDLTNAVKFWQSQGFCALAPRKKANTTGREVLIFHKRLSTPSLLPNEPLPLSITSKSITNILDSYVLDLNIFLTLLKKRNNELLISEIMQASMAGEFSLFVTPEFQEELRRNKQGDEDPILSLAEKTLPVLEMIEGTELEALKEEIRTIVFPKRSSNRKNAVNDESDLKHLAYCIHNSKVGFITEEKALLNAKDALQDKYGLKIFSPEDFKIEYSGNADLAAINVPISNDNQDIHISDVKNTSQIRPFLEGLGKNLSDVSKTLLKDSVRGKRERKIISLGENNCAVYVAQTKGTKHDALEGFFVAAGERFNSRELVFQHMLELFMRHAQAMKAKNIIFHIRAEDFDFEKVCIGRGFERAESSYQGMVTLIKIPCPLLITKSNWEAFRETFFDHTDIQLPRLIPSMRVNSYDTPIIQAAKAGRDYEADLFQLETLLSPSLLILPQRGGIILPIAPAFAENLLSRSESLLPFAQSEEALLRAEKAYFRKPQNTKMFSVGTPIIFYESGSGRGVIGCARITSVKVINLENALKLYRKHGVLDKKQLEKQTDKKGNVQVITFDNFKVFSSPVSMKRLQELGCAKANLVGPEKISYEQLSAILHEGTEQHTKDVLLSIQPNYVAKIVNGKKTIELRKKPFPANGGVRVWIYTTSPTSAIEASAHVSVVDADTPENIWNKYKNKCGVTKEEFDKYYEGSREAYAIHIGDVKRLSKKVNLEELKKLLDGFTPPQYYRYIPHDGNLFDKLINQ